MASVIYNQENKTIYAVTGTSHQGKELEDFVKLWDSVVVTRNLANFHCIMDMRALDMENYKPVIVSQAADKSFYGFETHSVRKRGNGKMVLVFDPVKGGSQILLDLFWPDGVFYSIEDAETFIRTGQGVSRVDLAEH